MVTKTNPSFDSFLESYDFNTLNEVIKQATVISLTDKFCIVDIKEKNTPMVLLQDLKDIGEIKIGTQFEVLIEKKEDKKGQMVLSHSKVAAKKAMDKAKFSLLNNSPITCNIKGVFGGGLSVDIDGLTAFLPASLIGENSEGVSLENYIGQDMDVVVVKISRTNNIIVSHRAFLENNIMKEKQEIISTLSKGQILEGVVANIFSYGAFISIENSITGLLRAVDISWGKVNNPNEVLKIGQKVKVVVLNIENKKISFGMKQLEKNPWEKMKEEGVEPGKIITTKVSGITEFGMFVEVYNGIDGLIHNSEFLWSQCSIDIKSFYKKGDEVKVKVLEVNSEEQKIFLSIKQVEENPFNNEKIMKEMSVGSKHTGLIVNITKGYALIKLDNNIDGYLNAGDISWTKQIKDLTKTYKVGEKIDVQVTSLDKKKNKVTFGVKQLSPNPWEENEKGFTVGSEHKGTVIKSMSTGFVVNIENIFEGFCSKKHVSKNIVLEVGKEYDFKIIEYDKENFHIELVEKGYKYDFNKKKTKKLESNTIADLIAKV